MQHQCTKNTSEGQKALDADIFFVHVCKVKRINSFQLISEFSEANFSAFFCLLVFVYGSAATVGIVIFVGVRSLFYLNENCNQTL